MAKIKVTYEFEDNQGYYGTHAEPFHYERGQESAVTGYDQAACLENVGDDIHGIKMRYKEMAFDSLINENRETDEKTKSWHTSHTDWLRGLIVVTDTIQIVSVDVEI